jgi:hypothetical protein
VWAALLEGKSKRSVSPVRNSLITAVNEHMREAQNLLENQHDALTLEQRTFLKHISAGYFDGSDDPLKIPSLLSDDELRAWIVLAEQKIRHICQEIETYKKMA